MYYRAEEDFGDKLLNKNEASVATLGSSFGALGSKNWRKCFSG